ncbi:MAG TPA: hypothetical protein VMJ32_13045, partial [Pirellulales bacterium]|nr:hypothetical protein [Pirellulales bacterium]
MLPEQRGLLASWFNRFRTSRRARRKGRGRLQGFTRLAQVESLEDRRLLTNTVFVDFGTRLNTVTMPEDTVGNAGGWDTWGYVPPNNGVNWVFGPEFNVAGNPNITYTPLRTLFANKGVSFNLSQMQTDFPWEYQTGTQTPLSQLDLLEGSIMNMLTQMFLPFNITVEEVTSTHFGSVNVTGAVNDPADFLGENNPLYDPNTYDPTAMPPTINRGPLFNPMQTNPTTMAPDQYQDVYILVGGFTIGGTQIGNSASDPANPGILGVFGATSYDIDSDTLQLSTNPAQRFVDPMYMDPSDPSGNGLLRYSDGGVAVNADTIFDHWLAQQANPAVTPINLNVTIAQVAAQGAAETWGLSTTSDGQPKPWNSFFDTNIDMLNSSDVMRQGPYTGNEYPTDFNMPFFENFYTMVGSLNEDPTDVQNAYEQFVNDPDIGPSVYAYITGTGAYDKIDITADAADPTMADVTISPYSDASFADSSFISSFAYDAANPTGYMTSAASPYSYTVDLSSGILLIDAGNNADQISIDPAIFNNLFEVFVFGGEGLTNGQVDNLSMAGDGTQSVAVAPSNMNLQTYNFAISYETDMEIVGPTSVTLLVASEFEDNSTIHLENFNSLTYTMPEFMGDDFTITGQNGSNLVLPPSVGETDMVIDGTAGPTTLSPIPVGVSNVEFTNIGTVTVQDPLGATDDSVAIDSTAGYADGLQNLAIILGPGNDSLTINGPIDLTPGVMGGTLTYDGGPGTNTLTVSDDTNWALTDSSLTDGLGNTIQFIGGVSIADITGGIDPHTFSVENWSGDAFLTALAGGDTFNIGDTAPVVGNVSIDASGFVGDLFNVKSFTGTGNFDFTGSFGANVFNVNTTDITLSLPAIGSGSASGYAGSAVNLATTSGSKTAKLNSTAGLFVGEAVVGPDIATGTTIAAIVNTTTITLSTVATGSGVNATLIGTIGANIVPVTYTTTSGSTDVTVSTVAGISVGQSIVGTNIPTGTTISGISNMTFVGGDGGNTFNITAWNGNGSITGGAGNDNFYIAAWTGTGPLIGGAGDDDFVFGTLSIISPSGNGNIDAITDPHTIIGGNGNDTLTLDDSGTNGAKNYTIGATSVSDSSTFGGVNFDSTLDNIVVIGSQGANTFLVTPNSKAAITIDGQLPTTIPGDTLNVDLTGTKGAKLTPNGPFGGTLTFTSGQRPITYSNIETTVPDLTQVAQQQQQSQQQQQMNTLLGELENDPLLVEAADPGTASAPLVKLYDVKTNTVLFSFDAYETTFKGGVRAEIVPDVTGDGVPDIVVAPGSGRLGE